MRGKKQRPTSIIALVISFLLLSSYILSQLGIHILPSSSSSSSSSTPLSSESIEVPEYKREAYVTFLSSGPDPEYFTSVRLQLFAIKHDPLTLDPIPRDVVIITYPSVPKHQCEQLSNEGAIIIPVEEITSIPNPWKDTDDHWRDVLGKLYVFNMTQYSRVMMLDGDMFLHKSLSGIWQDEHSWPKSGLAACGDGFAGHEIPQRNDPPFNSGFMMVVPDEDTFEELLEFRDYDHSWMDQAMLNSYFDQNGLHPWEPLDHKWVCNAPTMADIEFGIAVLHEKLWSLKYRHDNPPELMEMWQRRVGRMEGYWNSRSEQFSLSES